MSYMENVHSEHADSTSWGINELHGTYCNYNQKNEKGVVAHCAATLFYKKENFNVKKKKSQNVQKGYIYTG